jgi:hypothetical protein
VPALLQQANNGAGDGAFAGTRSAGEDADFIGQGHAHGLLLLIGQAEWGSDRIQPGEGPLPVDAVEGFQAVALVSWMRRRRLAAALRDEKWRQKNSLSSGSSSANRSRWRTSTSICSSQADRLTSSKRIASLSSWSRVAKQWPSSLSC